MTLKYESELLFDLMKRDGDDTPSDVLPYESELKEKYLNQVVGAYPKLQDYRPEWLYYNLHHYIPSYFPVESVANVTSASFYNVVPYAYNSAILTGQTLVNLINGGEVTENATNNWVVFSADFNADMIKTSTDYTLITYVISNTLSDGSGCDFGVSGGLNDGFSFKTIRVPSGKVGVYKIKLTTKNVFSQPPVLRQQIFNDVATGSITFKQALVEGDYTNVDVPYFEGMQSVKLPVLTTTGKNLFNNEFEMYGETANYITKYENGFKCLNYISQIASPYQVYQVIPNTKYTLSFECPNGNGYLRISDGYTDQQITIWYGGVSDERFLVRTFTTLSNKIKISFFSHKKEIGIEAEIINVQLEMNPSQTTYEPFKSNILTVNEPVELRGIGDAQDTLDLMTGEVVERVGEMVLDGSENWIYEPTYTNENVYGCYIHLHQLSQPPKPSNFNFANNVFPNITNSSYRAEGFATNPSTLSLRIAKDKLESADLSGFKKYLQNHPVTLQYPLATEVVKTVDLSCINEQGESVIFRPIEGTMHVNTSSQALSPLLDMSVPIEATTQNLMSFSNISEEE